MEIIKKTFSYYKQEHIIASFIGAFIISALYLYGKYMDLEGMALRIILFTPKYFPFALASTILYPFATGAYLEIKHSILGDSHGYGFILSMVSFIMFLLLYLFAIPIGILNIILINIKLSSITPKKEKDIVFKSEDKSDDITW